MDGVCTKILLRPVLRSYPSQIFGSALRSLFAHRIESKLVLSIQLFDLNCIINSTLFAPFSIFKVHWMKLERRSTHKEMGQKSFSTLVQCSKWKKVKPAAMPERVGTKIFQHFVSVLWMKLERRSSLFQCFLNKIKSSPVSCYVPQ